MIMMKRLTIYSTLAVVLMLSAAGCKDNRTVYSDREYVMFADTMSVNMIQREATTFRVPVTSTVACDYDRNFGVEIIDGASTAIERLHYRMSSSTVTIKAGERVADVEITADYDTLGDSDTLTIALRLLMPEAVRWELYGDRTKVKMVKAGTWQAEDFSGWCVVTSAFLYNYPGHNTSMQRLIWTEPHATEPRTVILRSFLYDGYDVSIRFKTDDASKPDITMDEDQMLGDSREIFYTVHGDGKVLAKASPYYNSYYNALSRFAIVYLYVHVMDLGDEYGVVDPYSMNMLEWVSDEEADRLQREEGLMKSPH